jgi:hypothetical protein
MMPTEGMSEAVEVSESPRGVQAPGASLGRGVGTTVTLQSAGGGCGCGCSGGANPEGERMTASYNYIYALGRVEPRFPSLAVEKEFA